MNKVKLSEKQTKFARDFLLSKSVTKCCDTPAIQVGSHFLVVPFLDPNLGVREGVPVFTTGCSNCSEIKFYSVEHSGMLLE